MKRSHGNLPAASRRIFSRDDAVAAYVHFARRAVDIFNAEGEVLPQLFFVALDDNEPRNIAFVKALEPEAVARFEDSNEGRARRFKFIADSFLLGSATADALKRQGMPVAPHFVAHIAEVSLRTGGAGDMPGTDGGCVSHEAVLVVIFTSERQYAGLCFIHESPRRCVYGALLDDMSVGLRSSPKDQAAEDSGGEDNPSAPEEPQAIH